MDVTPWKTLNYYIVAGCLTEVPAKNRKGVLSLTHVQLPPQQEHACQGRRCGEGKRHGRAEMFPGITACERTDRATYAVGEAAKNRLAAGLVPTTKQSMHDANSGSVKRTESRSVQALSEKKEREVLCFPADDEEAHDRQPEACDEYGAQAESGIKARQPEKNSDLADHAQSPQPARQALAVAVAHDVNRIERVVRSMGRRHQRARGNQRHDFRPPEYAGNR